MKFDRLIRSGRAGVYSAPRLVGPLRAAARRAGVAWLDFDLARVGDREAFFRRCAEVFALPDYFGHNFDALHECLLDSARRGTPGAIVHWRRGSGLARRAPDAVATAFRVLEDAGTYWSGSGRVFLVVVDRDSARGFPLRPLR